MIKFVAMLFLACCLVATSFFVRFDKVSQNSDLSSDSQQWTTVATCVAVVQEKNDASIIVTPVEGEKELLSSDKFNVNIKDMENLKDIKVGDKVKIAYSGYILETYPATFADIESMQIRND